MKRRIIAGLLSLLLILGTASCGKETSDPEGGEKEKSPVFGKQEGKMIAPGEKPYGGRVVSLPLEEGEVILDLVEFGEGYTLLTGKKHQFADAAEPHLELYDGYLQDLDGELNPMGEKQPAETEVTHSRLLLDGEYYDYAMVETEIEHGGVQRVSFALLQDGEVVKNQNRMSGDGGDTPSLHGFSLDGNWYLAESQGQFSDADVRINGNLLPDPELTPEGIRRWCVGVGELSGKAYALMREFHLSDPADPYSQASQDGCYLTELTPESKAFGLSERIFDVKASGPCASNGEFLWFTEDSRLFVTDGREAWLLCDLAIFGVGYNNQVRRILPLEGEELIVACETMLIRLAPGSAAKPLVIGALGEVDIFQLTNEIAVYNTTGPLCPVVAKEFPDRKSLNLALLSGEVDLVALGDVLAARNYAKQGYLLPLEREYPSLFEDGKLISSVRETSRWNGETYFLPHRVMYEGMYVDVEIWEEGAWQTDLSAYFAFAREKAPNVMKRWLNRDILHVFGKRLDEWIDWDAGTCHFTDQSFVDMIEYAADCAPDYDTIDANYTEEPSMISFGGYMKEIWSMESLSTFYVDDYYGRNIYQPMPSAVHQGVGIFADCFIGVVAGGDRTDGALAFLEYILVDYPIGRDWDGEASVFAPVSLQAVEEHTRSIVEAPYNGLDYEKMALHMAEMEENYWKAILSADHFCYGSQNEILDVVYEEAERALSGNITAKQAAEYVQNRISIYLAEQG